MEVTKTQKADLENKIEELEARKIKLENKVTELKKYQ